MDRKKVIKLKDALLYDTKWFEPRAGWEHLEAHAWRALAYYFANINDDSVTESLEFAFKIIEKAKQ